MAIAKELQRLLSESFFISVDFTAIINSSALSFLFIHFGNYSQSIIFNLFVKNLKVYTFYVIKTKEKRFFDIYFI